MNLSEKWIAFDPDKRWLRLLPDETLDYIIDRALDGKITKLGQQLILMPDCRKGKPDVCGVYRIGRIRKSECITIKQLVRRIQKTEGVTDKSKNTKLTPNQINTLEGEKTAILSPPMSPTRTTKTPTIRNNCVNCKKPVIDKRSDAKFCKSACRQKHYRIAK